MRALTNISAGFSPVSFRAYADAKPKTGAIGELFSGLATVVLESGATRLQFYPNAAECLAMSKSLSDAAEQLQLAEAVGQALEVPVGEVV